MSDITGHTLVIDAEGELSAAHPLDDIAECGFHEYVERDGPGFPRPSEWEFIRRTNDENGHVDWLGTRLDKIRREETP